MENEFLRLKKRAKLNRSELAELTGLSREVVQRITKGKHEAPKGAINTVKSYIQFIES